MWRALRAWWRKQPSADGDHGAGAASDRDAVSDRDPVSDPDRAAGAAPDRDPVSDRAPASDPDRAAEAASDRDPVSDLDLDPEAVTALTGDELDLHTFQPREVADVVAEYVTWAAEEGKRRVRIIHGKGTGALRRVVHSALAKHPLVESFALADERGGSWGATFVVLRAVGSATASPDDEAR